MVARLLKPIASALRVSFGWRLALWLRRGRLLRLRSGQGVGLALWFAQSLAECLPVSLAVCLSLAVPPAHADGWDGTVSVSTDSLYRGLARFAYDYDELNASVGWRGQWFASLAVSPNTTGRGSYGGLSRDTTWAFELTTRQRLTGRLALDAGIGYFDLHPFIGTGYPYASVGLSSGVGPVQAYVSFVTSRAEARGAAPAPLAGDHWVASLLWSF